MAPARGADIKEALVAEIEEALEDLPGEAPVTRTRKNVMPEGTDAAHSVTLGIAPKDGEESGWMEHRGVRHLYGLLESAIRAFDETFVFHSIQLNKNLRCRAHCDRGNRSPSLIVGFGDYTGGALKLWPGRSARGEATSVDVKHTFFRFDGAARLHETEAFEETVQRTRYGSRTH